MLGLRRPLSEGAKALNLLLTQDEWAVRRVESVAFLATGETRRRVSWDFTVPPSLAIRVGDKLAVPLATFYKRPLRRLDVTDGSGNALTVWSTEQNGRLAEQVLLAGLRVVGGARLTDRERLAVSQVVFAGGANDASAAMSIISNWIKRQATDIDLSNAVLAIAENLADGFLFIVEVPASVGANRHIVKASYDDAQLSPNRSLLERLRGRTTVDIETGQLSTCASWHLEAHTPAGVSAQSLDYELSEHGDDTNPTSGSDVGQSSTAHVSGRQTPVGVFVRARLRLAPTSAGMVNQVTAGSSFALALLLAGHQVAGPLSDLLAAPGRSGPAGAVLFSVPAFFLALLARAPEHVLVSRVLMPARVIAAGSAIVMWGAGSLIVLNPSAVALQGGLGILTTLQATLVLWLCAVRDVGGRP